jgi:DHA2 family multidrug resistance protein
MDAVQSGGTLKDGYKWWASLAVIVGMLSVNINLSGINVAVPKIMSGFGAPLDQAQWLMNAYMIAYTVSTPTVGWLGGWLGNKNLFLLSMAIFLFSMVLSGVSWNIESLIFFRVLSGMAGGLATPIGMVILYEAFPPSQHGLAMGISIFSLFSASIIAFPLGGYLIEELSWRYIFYLSVPLSMVGIAVGRLILRESGRREKRPLDVAGLAALSLFVVCLLLALSQGRREGWDSDYIMTLLALSAAAGVAFVIIELKVQRPMVDLRLFGNFNFSILNMVGFVNEMDLFGTFFLIQIYLQTFRGFTPLQAGLIMLPSVLVTSVGSILFGRLGDYIDTKYLITFGMAFRAFAIWRFTFLNIYTSMPVIISIVILRSLSNGWLMPNFAKGIMRSLPDEKRREGSGLMTLIRGIGSVTGVATLTAILTQRTDYHTKVLAETTNLSIFGIRQALSSLAGMFHQGGDWQGLADMKGLSLIFGKLINEAMMFAYRDTFLFMTFLLILAVLPSIFLRRSLPLQKA